MSLNRLRAVTLSVLLVVSVFAGTIAFAGTAGAANTTASANVSFERGGALTAVGNSISSVPDVRFNRTVTLDPNEGDALIVTNADTGTNVTVTPNRTVTLNESNIRIYDGRGDERFRPTIDTADQEYNVTVSGDAGSVAVEPLSNLTVSLQDNGSTVSTTSYARLHPVNYTGTLAQNSTSGTIEFSVPKRALPKRSTAVLVSFDSSFERNMTYDASTGTYRVTVDGSAINGTESGGVIFRTQQDAAYFLVSGDLESSTSSGGGSGGGDATGTANVSYDLSGIGTTTTDGATARNPALTFDGNVTFNASETDGIRVTNADNGAQFLVEPDEEVNVSSDAVLLVQPYDGNGSVTAPEFAVFENERLTEFNATVGGNTSAIQEPISNLTATYVDNGVTVSSTSSAEPHPINYTGRITRNSSTGTIEFTVPRQGLLDGSAELAFRNSSTTTQMSYDPGTGNYTALVDEANATSEAAVSFFYGGRVRYFRTFSQVSINGTGSTAQAAVDMTDLRGRGDQLEGVRIENVTLPDGGFVVVRDANFTDDPINSTRGASDYIEPVENDTLTVRLDDPISTNQTVGAFVHRDTDDDRTYDFTDTNGSDDGPYTDENGTVITDSESLELLDPFEFTLADQTGDGTNVTVSSATLPEGAFLAVLSGPALNDSNTTVFEAERGATSFIQPGTYQNETIQLDEPLNESQDVVLVAFRDTDNDGTYDFVATNGSEDGPHLQVGNALPFATAANYTLQSDLANVAMSNISGPGTELNRVRVDEVYLPEGGFVEIHDSTLATDGSVFGSVRGHSGYLGTGVHWNVTFTLDDPVTANDTLLAMPHRDTDNDQTYDFVATNGSEDGPYTNADGDPVVDSAELSLLDPVELRIDNQTGTGANVTVRSATLPDGGFVAIYSSNVSDSPFDAQFGNSSYLAPGTHRNVTVELNEAITENQTVFVLAFRDTDGDRTYDFPATNGSDDGPYVDVNGRIPFDRAEYTVARDGGSLVGTSGQPGFGLAAALAALAMLGAALLLGRRRE